MMRYLALAFAVVLAFGLAACSSGGSSDGQASGGDAAATGSASASDSAGATGAAQGGQAVDVSKVDYDVAAMSDEDAFAFMHDFMNRTPDEHAADFGKVMRIKGQVSRYAEKENGEEKAVSYSVGVKGEGGVIWGVNFYVDGWGPDDYPQNKSQVEVTGVYGEVDGYGTNAGKTLICNPKDVVVLSE